MEKFISTEIGTRPNGTKIVRNHFINETKINLLTNAQHHFTAQEKAIAKNEYKANKQKAKI